MGAMASTDYKYSANAWESESIPASCAHCSSGCSLYYDVKIIRDENSQQKTKIMRVKNDFEFSSLCGAGRFGFNFENMAKGKDEKAFNLAVEAIKNTDAIRFNSYITNEEALILQELKTKLGLKLFNEDAYNYSKFMTGYSSITGKSLYSANSHTISSSDAIIMVGTRISRDNPGIKYHVNMATKKQRAEFIYMHPIDDEALKNKYTQIVKYEVGSEEGTLALLCAYLAKDSNNEVLKTFIEDLDIGYLSGESSVGEEELDLIIKKLMRKQTKTLIIGTDIFGHKRAKNIGRIVGFIDKYTDFNVVIVPSQTNTLGVSLICDIDDQKDFDGKTVGYNENADFILSNDGNGDLNMPALNQQEGSFVGVDKKLLNTNVALDFDGYCLNDLALKILNNNIVNTIDYTIYLPSSKGFQNIDFDTLDFGFTNQGIDRRGYLLDLFTVEIDEKIEECDDLKSYNGSVVYRCEPLHQFNKSTAKSPWLKADTHLRGSASFAKAAKISAGDMVDITYNNKITRKMFKIDTTIKGTIALYPTFDNGLSTDLISSGYRYKQVKIGKVD